MKPRDRILNLLILAGRPLTGSEIAGICGLWSGIMYVALYRLERTGEVKSRWLNDGNPMKPRHRIYSLSWMSQHPDEERRP